MNKRELVEKIENALEMVVAVCGRKFRILRDEDDRLIIEERFRTESEKHYSDTYDMISRYKIDGNPLRNYIDAITIEKYVPLLQI